MAANVSKGPTGEPARPPIFASSGQVLASLSKAAQAEMAAVTGRTLSSPVTKDAARPRPKMEIVCDMEPVGSVYPVVVGLAGSGFDDLGDAPNQVAFLSTTAPPVSVSGELNAGYNPYVLADEFASTTPVPFTGTGAAMSIYFHAPPERRPTGSRARPTRSRTSTS